MLALLSGITLFTGCDIVTGSGETQTFEMDYTDFTRIEISTGFNVRITKADDFYVSMTVDKSLYEYLTLGKRGDTLLIGLKSNYTYTAATREAVINLPDLRRLALSGGSTAAVTGFSVTHPVDFDVSGASSLTLNPMTAGDTGFIVSGGSKVTGSIEMNNGTFTISGGAALTVKGKGAGIKLNGAGASVITLDQFPVGAANIELSGGTRAVICVSDLMDVNLDGASSLEYIGNPKLGSMKMSGGSMLNQIK